MKGEFSSIEWFSFGNVLSRKVDIITYTSYICTIFSCQTWVEPSPFNCHIPVSCAANLYLFRPFFGSKYHLENLASHTHKKRCDQVTQVF